MTPSVIADVIDLFGDCGQVWADIIRLFAGGPCVQVLAPRERADTAQIAFC
jgi:hypothetical protein